MCVKKNVFALPVICNQGIFLIYLTSRKLKCIAPFFGVFFFFFYFSPLSWDVNYSWINWFTELQLELYFAEDEACTSVEFYSPRNELEALNSIVLLIDMLLSSCTHLHTNILHGLRQIVLDLISDLGDKNSVKGVVEKDHSCEQEECLIKWGESNGVRTQLKIACKFHCDLVCFSIALLFENDFLSFARVLSLL